MLRLVDAHAFGNAGVVFVTGLDLPTQRQFAQRQAIRCVAVDLVRRSKNKRRFRTEVSRCFEQIKRAVGVNREIHLGIARRPIVRWLRGGVHNRPQATPVRFENFIHRRGIADVDLVMLICGHTRQQLIARFPSGRFLAEKSFPHVVVDPHDRTAIPGKTPDRFRTD